MTSTRIAASPAWFGFAVTLMQPAVSGAVASSVQRIAAGWQVELAGSVRLDWMQLARRLFVAEPAGMLPVMLTHDDEQDGIFRAIAFSSDEELIGALLVAPAPLDIARDWLAARIGTPLDPGERFRLLDGRPGGSMKPRGRIVCFCCHVGSNDIVDAIAAGSATIEAIGATTRAGTNCGRCREEIGRFLEPR